MIVQVGKLGRVLIKNKFIPRPADFERFRISERRVLVDPYKRDFVCACQGQVRDMMAS